MTDPIADMIAAIKNANQRFHDSLVVPHSKVKEAIVKVLKQEGFIRGYNVMDDPKSKVMKHLVVTLKYGEDKERVIRNIVRISKPGKHIYAQSANLPKVQSGFGIAIVSTSRGIMSSRVAKHNKLGGEIILKVW